MTTTSEERAARADDPPTILTLSLRDQTIGELQRLADLGFGSCGEIAALWLYRWLRGDLDPRVTTVPDGPRVFLEVPVEQVTLEKLGSDPRKAGEELAFMAARVIDRYAATFIENRKLPYGRR